MKSPSAFLAALLGLGILTAPALANPRTWVSGSGTDSGTCAFATPCRTFQYAIGQTDPGGEIDVKDSAPYGSFTITKAISIVGDPSQAHVGVPAGGAGITISANPDAIVILRGLTIIGDNQSSSQFGINIQSAKAVTIDHCVVTEISEGIYVENDTFTTITNSLLSGNGNGIYAHHGLNLLLGGNNITYNYFGVNGNFSSFGDNDISGNFSKDVTGSTTAVAKR